MMRYPLLYPILNLRKGELLDESFVRRIATACPTGFIQLRMKESPRHEVVFSAQKLIELLSSLQSSLIPVLNDYADIAVTTGFPFVHVGQDDERVQKIRTQFPHLKIGLSTHTVEQYKAACDVGADYVAFGPVFQTASKNTGYNPRHHLIEEIMNHKRGDIVFIGGITPENIEQLPAHEGVHAAVISSLPLFLDGGKK